MKILIGVMLSLLLSCSFSLFGQETEEGIPQPVSNITAQTGKTKCSKSKQNIDTVKSKKSCCAKKKNTTLKGKSEVGQNSDTLKNKKSCCAKKEVLDSKTIQSQDLDVKGPKQNQPPN
ncbi:MAG TPA: hypothetical protein QF753_00915 [Victivallales bacterium]|nr:hypothetical protein [Victivallales bacterium]